MTSNTENPIGTLMAALRRIANLYVENAKLTVAEKVTQLMGALAVSMIVLLFGIVALVFLVIGVATWLEAYIAPFWSYMIVAGVVIVMIVAVVVLRKPLIYNPFAKFITQLIIENPNEEKQ